MTHGGVAATSFEIRKYLRRDGAVPYDEWLNRLPEKAQARIDIRLDRASLGNFGDSASVGSGVHELRFFFGPGYRIYDGFVENRIVLLLCGGDKGSQKRDIAEAKALWDEFKEELEVKKTYANKKPSK